MAPTVRTSVLRSRTTKKKQEYNVRNAKEIRSQKRLGRRVLKTVSMQAKRQKEEWLRTKHGRQPGYPGTISHLGPTW